MTTEHESMAEPRRPILRPNCRCQITPAPDPRDAEIEQLRAELVDYRTRLGNDLLRGGELVERVRAAMRVDDGGTCTRASIGVVGECVRDLCAEIEQLREARSELDRLRASNYADEQLRFDAYAELLNPIREVFGKSPVGASCYRELRDYIDRLIGNANRLREQVANQRAEFERANADTVKAIKDRDAAEAERDRLRADLARERAIYADSPDDRLYHAADNTWWRRNDNGRLVEAEMPQLADITERDQLRRQLAQHLADENSAQAANDRLRQELDLQHADRLRWLCEALNVNPANETWLTAMRRVRHLRQNFGDSPRCEVAESDGWRCRLFAGHDGRHLAQMPTGERREWPFDNRLTPRYWRAGDPEPEIGTTVRPANSKLYGGPYTRRHNGWHTDFECPPDCDKAGGSWSWVTSHTGVLVEVVSTDGD